VIVFPLAAALVALVFAGMLARQYAQRRRPFQILWSLALLMYAGASFALFLGEIGGWSTAEFRTYWLLGAVLNVPFLAMGELYLLIPRQGVSHALFVLLLVGTAVAVATIRTAPMDTSFLTHDLPLGKEVFGDGTAAHRFAALYTYPAYFLLLGGTLWSALRIRGIEAMRDRFVGTLLIAGGATIVAIGSGVGAGVLKSFVVISLALLAGMVVMFLGFLRAGRRPATG
jgi:hypothetical protein